MHQDVGTAREFHEVVGAVRVARDDDRPVGRVESVGERVRDQGMLDAGSRHLHVLVLHYRPVLRDLVGMNERHEGNAPLIRERTSMSGALISKKSLVIFSRGGGPHVSTRVRSPLAHANHGWARAR